MEYSLFSVFRAPLPRSPLYVAAAGGGGMPVTLSTRQLHLGGPSFGVSAKQPCSVRAMGGMIDPLDQSDRVTPRQPDRCMTSHRNWCAPKLFCQETGSTHLYRGVNLPIPSSTISLRTTTHQPLTSPLRPIHHPSPVRQTQKSATMDKQPVKLVKVTRVLGRTGTTKKQSFLAI